MLKKSLLAAMIVAISSFAQAPKEINQSESLDIKMLIQESIAEIEKNQDTKVGGWFIKNRKKGDVGESFTAILTAPRIDTNVSNKNDIAADEIYKDLAGLSIYNDINYTKDSFSAISMLMSLPDSAYMSKDDNLLANKIINDKVFVFNSNYNTNNHSYLISLKDINLSIPNKVKIETKNIQINGYYDQNDLASQQNQFSIDSINLIPLKVNILGNYIKMKNFKVISKIEANGENINFNYAVSMDLLDMNIDKEHSKIEKVNLSMAIGNLNLKACEGLLKFSQENRENLENLEKIEELQILILELFAKSKNMYIEISDLSLLSSTIEGKEMGPVKMTFKVSLKGTRELIQMIVVNPNNPELALTAFSMEVKIELNKEILKEVYKKDKSVGSLAFLFAKYQNESLIYDVTYKEGKLIINDQLFTDNILQNLNKYAPQIEATPSDKYEEKKDIGSNNTKQQAAKVNSKHAGGSNYMPITEINIQEYMKRAKDAREDVRRSTPMATTMATNNIDLAIHTTKEPLENMGYDFDATLLHAVKTFASLNTMMSSATSNYMQLQNIPNNIGGIMMLISSTSMIIAR